MRKPKTCDGVTDWRPVVMCELRRAEFDFVENRVDLHLGDGHCTDMEGAIAFAERVMPTVEVIQTWAGADGIDTAYRRTVDGWAARPAR